MINLIPNEARKNIVREYWVRVVSVWMTMLGVASLLLAFLMLPVYVLVNTQVEVYSRSAEDSASRVSEYDLSAKSLFQANAMAEDVIALRKTDRFSGLRVIFEESNPPGITITSLDFNRDPENNIAPVTLIGMAATRQDLADFRNELLRFPEVAEVVLPISNLAKERNIEFTMSVKLNAKEI